MNLGSFHKNRNRLKSKGRSGQKPMNQNNMLQRQVPFTWGWLFLSSPFALSLRGEGWRRYSRGFQVPVSPSF